MFLIFELINIVSITQVLETVLTRSTYIDDEVHNRRALTRQEQAYEFYMPVIVKNDKAILIE